MIKELIAKGTELLQQGDLNNAKPIFEEACRLEPNNPEPHYLLGFTQFHLGNYQETANGMQRVLQLNPNVAEANYLLGFVLWRSGYLQQADNYFRKAIKQVPEFSSAYVGLAYVSEQLGNANEAEAYFRHAIQLTPEYAEAYDGLGNLLLRQERVEEAKGCFQKALEHNPEDQHSMINLGLILQRSEDYPAALDLYAKAIAVNPNNPHAWFFRADLHRIIGDHEAGIADALHVIGLAPDHTPAHMLLGHFYQASGNMENAAKQYRKALELEPDNLINLLQMPSGINPKQQQHFLRAIYLSLQQPDKSWLPMLLTSDELYQFPMLASRLLNTYPPPSPESFFPETIRAKADRCMQQASPFQNLFKHWRAVQPVSRESLTAEAILQYYLGDPLRAYEIFDGEIDTDEIGLNMCSQYYFCLSAAAILEEEQSINEFALQQARIFLAEQTSVDLLETYYAGLILQHAGALEEAEKVSSFLAPHVKSWASAETIEPPVDPAAFLEAILPLVHFAEKQPVTSSSKAGSLALQDLFYKGIRLADVPNQALRAGSN